MFSASLQDYLEVILSLSQKGEPVRVTDIASELNIAKASVTQALSTLKKEGMIYQDRYGPVRLTEKGSEYASKIFKRHRIIRSFLEDVLQVDPVTAEKDACLLEHVVSDCTFEQIKNYMNNHGFSVTEN